MGKAALRAAGGPDVAVGDVLLSVENVSLSFGGVKAVSDVSFDIHEGEIRAIDGRTAPARPRSQRDQRLLSAEQAASATRARRAEDAPAGRGGMAALPALSERRAVHGMTTLDNIMAVSRWRCRKLLLAAAAIWSGACGGSRGRKSVEEIIDFLKIAEIRRVPVGRLPYGLHKRWSSDTRWPSSRTSASQRTDGRHEPQRKGGHVGSVLDMNDRSAPRSR